MKTKIYKYTLWLALLMLSLTSCEIESNYRFKDEVIAKITTGSDSVNLANYPTDGSLAFHENFRKWNRDGYVNEVKQDCETDLMTTTIIMYRPDKPVTRTYNNKFSVTYSLQDFSVNPTCGNKAGTSTDTSTVSLGYVALQSDIFYECGGHNSDAFMTLSKLPSISKIQFSISYGGDVEYVGGLSVWKKSDGETDFTRIGDYKAEHPEDGQMFTLNINERNVQLRFTPAISDKGAGVNDGVHANRSVRIHDLLVWSLKQN